MLNCIDNSGAAIVECVNVIRMKRHAKIGDRIIVVVQKQRNFGPESGPGASVSTTAANKVRRGDIRHAVVVRTAKKIQRPDGSVVKFDDNACVLINKTGEPIGTRLNGLSYAAQVELQEIKIADRKIRCGWQRITQEQVV
ncbi:54S ribosomal protein L38, mitochondrial [Golovinomyces cichoracearum]|uniref:Large ribosomal subunit protein uL14m n=1 Tax=Golovinomyces cichoracearum TaxID=62708 RepID=A0A420IES0_9PEZI|nr:54S ribosomal protein L38, mitochondrial [Golovinomyces cichoracearum]